MYKLLIIFLLGVLLSSCSHRIVNIYDECLQDEPVVFIDSLSNFEQGILYKNNQSLALVLDSVSLIFINLDEDFVQIRYCNRTYSWHQQKLCEAFVEYIAFDTIAHMDILAEDSKHAMYGTLFFTEKIAKTNEYIDKVPKYLKKDAKAVYEVTLIKLAEWKKLEQKGIKKEKPTVRSRPPPKKI